jgi:uncharacterized protein with HEPN domain
MTQRDDLISFGDMLDAALEARRIAAGMDRADLEANRVVQLALLHLVQIIGEAAREVSEQGRSALPQIPWPRVVGMRNRIVHDYRNINLGVLWDTLTNHLPPLIAALETVVPPEPPASPAKPTKPLVDPSPDRR